jgi:hypothetical protein
MEVGGAMNLGVFIDVAIGIILMYLILSLMCTTVNELIATVLKLRAQMLSKTISAMIDDEDVRKAFYNHGIIANAKSAARGGEPAPGTSASDSAGGRGQEADAAGRPRDREHPSYLESRNFAMALLDSLDPSAQRNPEGQTAFPSISDIEGLVAKMRDSDIRDVMLANIATAKGDIENLRNNVAEWFDTAMDRLSGDYKRSSKRIALWVGIGLAALLNADSLTVATALWNDEALRSQAVSTATDALKNAGGATAGSVCTATNLAAQTKCLAKEWNNQQALLRPFPIGWHAEQLPNSFGSSVGWVLGKIGGLLWTGIALSLGAPFWFDFLQKFMNVRGAGPNPAEKKQSRASE